MKPSRKTLAWWQGTRRSKGQPPIIVLKADIEDFYFHEADLLDERKFRDWLDILADDISYFMPIRRNVKFGQHAARGKHQDGRRHQLVR